MVAVTFGDSKEEYHMLLDSAASNTWVMGQDCSSESCKTHATFGKGYSSTLKVCRPDIQRHARAYSVKKIEGWFATERIMQDAARATW
jgi:hypothetical protein